MDSNNQNDMYVQLQIQVQAEQQPQMRNQGQNQNQNQMISLSQLGSKIPFGCRVVFFTVVCFWVLDFFYITTVLFMNNVDLTWGSYHQIWRLVTSSFCLNSIFYLMLACLNCYTFMPKLENRIGSINILLQVLIIGAIIQTIYTAILVFVPVDYMGLFSYGSFLGIWFNFIFKYCFYNSNNQIKMCCFPLKIKKIAYPFIFLAILMVLDLQVKLDASIGIFIALLECKLLNGNLFLLKDDQCLSFFEKFSCWVKANNGNLNESYRGLQQQMQVPRWTQSTKQSNEDYFKNKKGVRLSDG